MRVCTGPIRWNGDRFTHVSMYIVMAYIHEPYRGMAYVVMAYVVMAYIAGQSGPIRWNGDLFTHVSLRCEWLVSACAYGGAVELSFTSFSLEQARRHAHTTRA